MSAHRHPVDRDRVAAAGAASLDAEQAARLRELIEVVGEPVRARVLSALQTASPLCVGDIALALGVSEDAVSYALRQLRARGLVAREAQGRFAFYRLAGTAQDHPLLEARSCGGNFASAWWASRRSIQALSFSRVKFQANGSAIGL